jgi:hypothetical protein
MTWAKSINPLLLTIVSTKWWLQWVQNTLYTLQINPYIWNIIQPFKCHTRHKHRPCAHSSTDLHFNVAHLCLYYVCAFLSVGYKKMSSLKIMKKESSSTRRTLCHFFLSFLSIVYVVYIIVKFSSSPSSHFLSSLPFFHALHLIYYRFMFVYGKQT